MDNKQYIQDMDGGRLYRNNNGYSLRLKNKSIEGGSITEIKKQLAEQNRPKPSKKRKSSRKSKAKKVEEAEVEVTKDTPEVNSTE